MKTKIIYISGNEVFEMAEIRAAFEEVRAALGLGQDTILFGVPVDADNALAVTDINITDTEKKPVVMPTTNIESEITDITEPVEQITEIEQETTVDAPEANDDIVAEAENTESPTVIPILSVLSAKEEEPETNPETEFETEDTDTAEEPIVAESEPMQIPEPIADTINDEQPVILDMALDTQLINPDATDDATATTISLGDMITNDAPVPQQEQTLEQLLESTQPLCEDKFSTPDDIDILGALGTNDFQEPDTDATLAQLASEFAKSEDKIAKKAGTQSQGKISKLKGFIPFKKRTEENNFMDGLFSWAGMAANDDGFSGPGFFTPASSKK